MYFQLSWCIAACLQEALLSAPRERLPVAQQQQQQPLTVLQMGQQGSRGSTPPVSKLLAFCVFMKAVSHLLTSKLICLKGPQKPSLRRLLAVEKVQHDVDDTDDNDADCGMKSAAFP